MFIKIVSVNREEVPSKNGKGTYGKLTVAYRDDKGKLSEKQLFSFNNPAVFKHLADLSANDEVNVKSEKVGDYWQWTAILGDEPETKSVSNGQSQPTRVTGSNYETKEERAVKQRYIVKQSSLSSAVAILTVGAKSPPSVEEVIKLADKFVEYVFEEKKVDLSIGISDIEDDIPY